MNIFKKKSDLCNRIERLETENQRLINDQQSKIQEIRMLNKRNDLLAKQNKELVQKYEKTGIECSECYFMLQKSFKVCPNCGKKIIKNIETKVHLNDDIYEVEYDGNSCLIVGYKGFRDKKIVIPSNINGFPVIGIWNDVFRKCEYIEEVIFEEGCLYIGNNAFAECPRLGKVKLPKSLLEIGSGAFAMDKVIKEMIVPVNVKKVGAAAFSGCGSLTKVILPERLEVIEVSLLNGTSIHEINIPETVQAIGTYAFARTNLSEVELPEQLRVIQDNAFEGCAKLKKIIMHSNLEIIEKDIFTSCKPIIYCSAGSKAQLYGRKYHFDCEEIAPINHKKNVRMGVKYIELSKSARSQISGTQLNIDHYTLYDWLELMGCAKASAYAFDVQNSYGVRQKMTINKYHTYEEAQELKRKLEIKGVHVYLSEYWGQSVV